MFKKLSLSKLFILLISLRRSKKRKPASSRKKATIHFKRMSDDELYGYTLKLLQLCDTMPEFSKEFRAALDKAAHNLPLAKSDFTFYKTPVAKEQMEYWRIYSKVIVMKGIRFLNDYYFSDKASWASAGFAPKPFILRKATRTTKPRTTIGRFVVKSL